MTRVEEGADDGSLGLGVRGDRRRGRLGSEKAVNVQAQVIVSRRGERVASFGAAAAPRREVIGGLKVRLLTTA